MIKMAEITPYGQALQIMAIPRKEMDGVRRGASRPAALWLQAEVGHMSSGSQETK